MSFGMTLAEHLTMAASANMFYFAVAYENEPNMKVAARMNTKYESSSHANTKNPLFFKQRILGVHVTTAQRKSSGGFTRTDS